MSTFADLAEKAGFQPYELAAYLGLGVDYDESAELDAATEAEYWEIIAAGANDHSGPEEGEALRLAIAEVRAAEAALSRAILTRDQEISRLVTVEGYTKYRAAQMSGLSQTMVARIVAAAL